MADRAPRTQPSARVYRQLMSCVMQRKRELGLANWQVDDLAGCADHYLSKAASPDRPQGRQATWPVVEELLTALYPDGYALMIHSLGPKLPRGAQPGRPVRSSAPKTEANPEGLHWQRLRRPLPKAYLLNPDMEPEMDSFFIRYEALRLASEQPGSAEKTLARAAAYETYLRGPEPVAPQIPAPANTSVPEARGHG